MKHNVFNIKNSAIIFTLIVALLSLPSMAEAVFRNSNAASPIFNNAVNLSIRKNFRLQYNGNVFDQTAQGPLLTPGTQVRDASYFETSFRPPFRGTPNTLNNGRSNSQLAVPNRMPMDGVWRRPSYQGLGGLGLIRPVSTNEEWWGEVRPNSFRLESTKPSVISCAGQVCTAVGNGGAAIQSASIRYIPGGSQYTIRGRNLPSQVSNNNTGCSSTGPNSACREAGYFFGDPIFFNVRVRQSQQPPSVSYRRTRDIGYNNATSDWTYSDPNGDRQSVATVTYFRDAARTVIGARGTINQADQRALALSGLRAGTTYWPRVFVRNEANQTAFADGPAFTTRSFPQASISFNVRDINGGTTIAGETLAATWTVNNPIGVERCTAFTSGSPNINTSIWNGGKTVGANQSQNISLPRSQVQKTYRFRLRCDPKPGGNPIPEQVREFVVQGTPATLTFTVNESTTPTAITAGQPVRLAWSTTNPEVLRGCTASTGGNPSPNWNNAWSGDKARNGNQTITIPPSQINRTYSFVLTCNPIDGNSPTRTISLPVTGTPATLNFRLNDVGERGNDDLRQGDNLVFVWQTTNPQVITTCEGSTVGTPNTLFSGNKNKNGATSTARVPDDIRVERDYIFGLTCNVVDGNPITRTITAKVKPKPPISCSLINRIVSDSNKNIVVDFDTDPTWTGPYRWLLKRGFGSDIVFDNSNNDNRQTLDYTDIVNQGLGKYELRAQLIAGGISSDEVVCGVVNSLGNRTIREISP